MQMRKLGRTGLEVSAIGCGGIPIFRASKSEAVKVIRHAMDKGINYFDTARGYASGGSEERFGEAIKGRRHECYIASKSPTRTRDGMLKDIDASLKTLQMDMIDIYMCHHVISPEELETVMKPGGAVEGLKEAQAAGKIRYIGITGHRPEVLAEACKTGEIDALLIVFNFVANGPATKLLPVAKEMDVGVTVMKPLGGSLFQHPNLCLRWLLQHDISTICVGMWKESEVDQNVLVGENPAPLNEEEQEWLEDEKRRWDRVYCRLCYTCNPCELGVSVRDLMIADLNYRRFGLKMMMAQGFDKKIEKIESCIECDDCSVTCAYELPIRDLMLNVRKTYAPIVEEVKLNALGK